MRSSKFQIVTSTRFAQRNGRGREGERADRKPVERANRVLVTAGQSNVICNPAECGRSGTYFQRGSSAAYGMRALTLKGS
jgi:hypothetical protein